MGMGRPRIRPWSWVRRLVFLLPISLFLFPISPSAQTVVEVLQEQRRQARVAEIMEEIGPRVPPRPLVEVGRVDAYTAAFRAVQAERAQALAALARADSARADSVILAAQLATLRWSKVEPDSQGPFLDAYGETFWRAASPRGILVDSLGTMELRGRLQAAFGRPTRNADAQRRHGYGGSEFIQFEYWFVVNDSIPLLALDLDGPFSRGLLIATDERYAPILPRLKADLSEQLEDERPAPWIDYYHAYERQSWYRTGFNGSETFTVRVRPPRWSGRVASDRWVIHR